MRRETGSIGWEYGYGMDAVPCQHCGDSYTHQQRTVVFERSEDEPEARITVITARGAHSHEGTAEGCPSPRRHGLFVVTVCEACEKHTRVSLFQHKGCTYVLAEPIEGSGWDVE